MRRPVPTTSRIALLVALILASGLLFAEDTKQLIEETQKAQDYGKQINSVWWNRPQRIEELELDKELRERLDAMAVEFLDAQVARRDQQASVIQAFNKALVDGDWEAAKEINGTLSQSNAAQASAGREFRIQVLSQLSDEQRKAMVENYPQIMRRQWLRLPARSLVNKQQDQPEQP